MFKIQCIDCDSVPDLKKKFYACLALEQITLKDWFIKTIEEHMKNQHPEIFTMKNNKK